MQEWTSIFCLPPRKSLLRSTIAHPRKQWIELNTHLPWEAELEGGGGRGRKRKRTMIVSFTQFIQANSGLDEILWQIWAFFTAKKEHLILAYKCKFWAWSSNLILICQHLKIQCKDNVLKSSVVELYWPLAQLSLSKVPKVSQKTLSVHKLSHETSASAIHSVTYLLGVSYVPGNALGVSSYVLGIISWVLPLMELLV
jgi:hypothetical protein